MPAKVVAGAAVVTVDVGDVVFGDAVVGAVVVVGIGLLLCARIVVEQCLRTGCRAPLTAP